MVITPSKKSSGKASARFFGGAGATITGTMKFSANYATGGELLDLSSYFANGPDHVSLQPTGGYIFEYNLSTKKVLAKQVSTSTGLLVEVAASTALASLNIPFVAFGF